MSFKVLYSKDVLNKKLKDPEFRKLYEEEEEIFKLCCFLYENPPEVDIEKLHRRMHELGPPMREVSDTDPAE